MTIKVGINGFGRSLAIVHFDWIPLSRNVVESTEALISSFNPSWSLGGGTGLHPRWLRDASEAGLVDLETFSHDVVVPFTHEGWRGRIRASAGVGASLPAAKVREFDDALAQLLTSCFPEEPMLIPHRLFAVTARAPGG